MSSVRVCHHNRTRRSGLPIDGSHLPRPPPCSLDPLSSVAMLDKTLILRTLTEALARGGDLAELFVERRSSTALRLDDSRVEDVASGREAGAGVRVISGERASYAYTNLLTEQGLSEAAQAARAGFSGAEGVVATENPARAA